MRNFLILSVVGSAVVLAAVVYANKGVATGEGVEYTKTVQQACKDECYPARVARVLYSKEEGFACKCVGMEVGED